MQAARKFRGMFSPPAEILLYHRVNDFLSDPFMLCVTPQNFAEHLQVIHEVGHPIQLEELARGMHDGNMPRRAVCVTFDDGYADNLYTAKPLLERYDVPATVFMTTGSMGRSRELWWDELERVFLQPGSSSCSLATGCRWTALPLGPGGVFEIQRIRCAS